MLQNSTDKLPNQVASIDTSFKKNLKRYLIVFVFSVLSVITWVIWTSLWDQGLYGDNVEQFVWSQSMELGYHKHPPLPTWLLGLATHLVGSHWWLTNALAAICTLATGLLTWLIATRLLGERMANIAIVLWSLQQCFSVSAEIYNHNTVLVLCLAGMTYTVLRALSSKNDLPWWLASGGLAAAAMLAKYQAAMPLIALLIVIFAIGKVRGAHLAGRLALAFAVFLLIFSPHLLWGISNHFPSLRYASEALESGDFMHRISWVVTFAVNQARMVLPLLLTILLSVVLTYLNRHSLNTKASTKSLQPSKIPADQTAGARVSPQEVTIWMWGLLWAPILTVIAISLISGSALRNHWGIQLFQFLSLWLAWKWSHLPFFRLRNLIAAALVIHGVGFFYYVVKQSDPKAVLTDRRADSAYPAQRMSDAAVAHWKLMSNCPLRFVTGDFEAGLVSSYSKAHPLVYTNTIATPWVSTSEILQHGSLYVLGSNIQLPADVTGVKQWFLSSQATKNNKYVQFAVKLPAKTCSGA